MYGMGGATEYLMVNEEALRADLDSRSRMIEVKIGGKVQPAVVKEVQLDHLGSDLYHIDLERIDLAEIVKVQVGIETHGTPNLLHSASSTLRRPGLTKVKNTMPGWAVICSTARSNCCSLRTSA
jgi:hypothetical protein